MQNTMRRLGLLLLWTTLVTVSSAQRLFFSKYIHTTIPSTNSVIEVFNPACVSVQLAAEFHIRIAPYSTVEAGSAWGTAISFTQATLAANATTSICRSFYTGCTLVNSNLNFGGSDAIGLFHNNVLIDIIGTLLDMDGDDCANCVSTGGRSNRAAPWDVAGTVDATLLHSMKRVATVTEGVTDFFNPNGAAVQNKDSSQWQVFAHGTNVLGFHSCTLCVCPTGLFFATCGTTAERLPLLGTTAQIVCPLDCLFRTSAQNVVGTGVATLIGSAGKYYLTSPICLAAMHSNIITYNQNAFPASSYISDPNQATSIQQLCRFSPTTSQPLYSDPLIFPSANRPNGRPHISFTSLSGSQTFVAASTTCLSSNGATLTGGYQIALLDTTLCDATQCGGSTKGHCNQNTGICKCNGLYYGTDCSLKHCEKECYNGGGCNPTNGTCSCNSGFSGEQCILRTCNCNGRGVCDATTGLCSCYSPFFGLNCELRLCLNNCTYHGACDHSTGTCHCDNLHIGEDCSLRPCQAYCSGHGMCDYTIGQCRCTNSGANAPVPTQCLFDSCPTSNAQVCSGQGVCDFGTRSCTCYEGWVGEDCATQSG